MCLGGALSKGDCSLHLAAGIFIVHNSRYAARPIIRDIILPGRESNRDNSIRFPDSALSMDTRCGTAEFLLPVDVAFRRPGDASLLDIR